MGRHGYIKNKKRGGQNMTNWICVKCDKPAIYMISGTGFCAEHCLNKGEPHKK